MTDLVYPEQLRLHEWQVAAWKDCCSLWNNPRRHPQGVFWSGPAGVGKTFLAGVFRRWVIRQGGAERVFGGEVPDLVAEAQDRRYGSSTRSLAQMLEQIRSAEVVILDEIGRANTDTAKGMLLQMLNAAMTTLRRPLPLVIALSNRTTKDQLAEFSGDDGLKSRFATLRAYEFTILAAEDQRSMKASEPRHVAMQHARPRWPITAPEVRDPKHPQGLQRTKHVGDILREPFMEKVAAHEKLTPEEAAEREEAARVQRLDKRRRETWWARAGEVRPPTPRALPPLPPEEPEAEHDTERSESA